MSNKKRAHPQSNRKRTRDYGMREHEVEQISMKAPDAAERLQNLLRNMMGPDEAREHNADLIRKILADAGIHDPHNPSIATKCGPESFHVLGAEWLQTYQALSASRARVEDSKARRSDVMMLVHLAEELGKLQERIWWRHGVDPQTGKKREALALAGRGLTKGGKKGRQTTHGTEEDMRALWQRLVDDFRAEYARVGRVGVAQKNVAKRHGVSTKRVQRARLQYLNLL